MGGPSTFSLVRRFVWGLRGRLSVAKLECPPLPDVQICVSELLQVKKCPHCRAVGQHWEGVGSARSKELGKKWKIS